LLLDREATYVNSGLFRIVFPILGYYFTATRLRCIITVFPEKPVDFGALDGQPVHTLFSISLQIKLIYIYYPSWLIWQPAGIAYFSGFKTSLEALLAYIKDWETKFVIKFTRREGRA